MRLDPSAKTFRMPLGRSSVQSSRGTVRLSFYHGLYIAVSEPPTQMDKSFIDPEIERDFNVLAQQWRDDTAHVSLSNERANHFAYHQIMAMGEKVLPLIFRELMETTSDWFWALRAIARDKAPVILPEDRGRVRRIAEIWMEWGRNNGYVSN